MAGDTVGGRRQMQGTLAARGTAVMTGHALTADPGRNILVIETYRQPATGDMAAFTLVAAGNMRCRTTLRNQAIVTGGTGPLYRIVIDLINRSPHGNGMTTLA